MNIAVLGPPPEVGFTPVYGWLKSMGEKVTLYWDRLQPGAEKYIDFIVSHRYRYILSEEVLGALEGRAINLHPSMLPYNRGVQPNFFSWFYGTPKGVSIHWMNETTDGGDIIKQRHVQLTSETHTLRTSYEVLQKELFELFREVWCENFDDWALKQDLTEGRNNTMQEFLEHSFLIWDKGWDTPVSKIQEAGRVLSGYSPFHKVETV